jgi:uncharacterized protein (DUF2236 family)
MDAEVTRRALEERLAEVRAAVDDPVSGLFGPGSMAWEVSKETTCFLGAGRAALLQLAHPHVSWAIHHHSSTRNDPAGRFQRTFFHVFRMVFGDLDTVIRTARAVHAIHDRVAGTVEEAAGPFAAGAPYRANASDALLWVHATLVHTSVLCYECVVRDLSLAEKDAYYRDMKRFAYLFGLDDDVLPSDWSSFDAYVTRTLESDLLTVTRPAAEMSRFLFGPLFPGAGPLARRYAEFTAWLLPERLACSYGLSRGGEPGRRRHEADLRRLRWVWPRLPSRLRYLPPYLEASRRVAGSPGRDRVGEVLNRILVGQPSSSGR